jgi:aspartate racemase
MKTIGLIGGMSWESSIEYYRLINKTVRERLGGLHSAKILMYSVDFAEIEILQKEGKWEEATAFMVEAAHHVEKGGADFILICTNTMHKMAEDVQKKIVIPLLHIADATGEKIKGMGLSKIGLLGTKFTMEEDFYKGRLEEKYNLEILIPGREGREVVHRVIYDELVLGVIDPASREKYLTIVEDLVCEGAQGIILGCTEIGSLLRQQDVQVPVFDTTLIHSIAAVDRALSV